MTTHEFTPIELKTMYRNYIEYSVRYYHYDQSVITDSEYDTLCQILHDNWDKVDHHLKHLTDKEALKAGTGYQIKLEDVPSVTKSLIARNPNRRLGEVGEEVWGVPDKVGVYYKNSNP